MNNLNETLVKDCTGSVLNVGDLVIRSLYSGLTFHRVLKINKKTVKLSRGRIYQSYGTGGYYRNMYCKNPLQVDLEEYSNHVSPASVLVWGDYTVYSIFKIQ